MSSFFCQGFKISYLDVGQGIPFFFQHGLGNRKENVCPLLAGIHGLRIISFDCLGHGNSSPASGAEYSFACYGDVLFALMAHLGIKRAAFGGISMGAALALHCAARHPSRCAGLFIVRPAWSWGPMAEERRTIYEQISKFLLMENGREAYLSSDFYQTLFQWQPSAAESFLPFFDDAAAKETAEKFTLLPLDNPVRADAPQQVFESIPTMILPMKDDLFHPVTAAEELHIRIPHAFWRELTPKYLSPRQYEAELRFHAAHFLCHT